MHSSTVIIDNVTFQIDDVTVQFNTEKDRDYFACESSTAIGQRLALDSVKCNSSVFSFVQSSIFNLSSLTYSLRISYSLLSLMSRR